MKRYLNRPLRIILFVDFLVLSSAAMFAPLQAIFVQKVGGDVLDAGLASTAFALVAACVVVAAGKRADKSRHKQKLVALGYLFCAIGFAAYLAVDSVLSLFIVQAWIGMSQAFIAPAYDALYTDQIGPKRLEGTRWSIWEASNYLAIATGGVVGGLIGKYFGFPVLFVLMSALCLFSALYLFSRPNRYFRN
ncbi:MFS transporter [Candidatus Saccharibacteria bacterium]|nr:MFS transporter [Candidatus Saccharibacteria bacterium]